MSSTYDRLSQNAYSERDLRLAERVGTQIAGAIANAQLFADHKGAEEALRNSEERFRIANVLFERYRSGHVTRSQRASL